MTASVQPRVDPAQRPRETRSFLPGFVFCVAGLLGALYGLGRLTSVEKVSGDLALETEVNMAIAHGGVRYVVEQQAGPESEFDRARRRGVVEGMPGGAGWREPARVGRLRIDLTSKEPCPT